ncbi:hypothetical protein [Escherichia coli]|uniref:hypothetical protein n=1 Tax=Escherichia coli TaxID=562 RepID=UPI0012FF6929|nr:hypothetical protein [Escherichia coli]
MTTPHPPKQGRLTNEDCVSPDPHKVLNNHYKPLIKLNYNDSLELAPPEQGKKNLRKFRKILPTSPTVARKVQAHRHDLANQLPALTLKHPQQWA